jgi:ABC-type cobalt transport system substrate-binding protein
MTTAASTLTANPPRQLGHSIVAGLAGFFATAGLSLATDQILHVLNVYPPWSEPMWNPWLNALALAYRIAFTVGGGYITAMLAPYAPMRLVAILGAVGTVFATAGAIAAISIGNFGPNWYPIALAITGFPCVWIGGLLHERRARRLP